MVFFITSSERLKGKTPINALRAGWLEQVKYLAAIYGEQGLE